MIRRVTTYEPTIPSDSDSVIRIVAPASKVRPPLEAGVAGIPDPYRGETVKAWIVLKPGQEATADEIKAWCKERLAAYKVPTHFEFRQELPKTTVGKILRRELPKYGGTFVQCEDEIAAISMAIGASFAGRVAVTGSSGPGISLKMEAAMKSSVAARRSATESKMRSFVWLMASLTGALNT